MAEHVDVRNLKRVRDEAGVSQEDLSRASGINRRTIQRYENGEMQTSVERASHLAGYLGVRVEDIIYRESRSNKVSALVEEGLSDLSDGEVVEYLKRSIKLFELTGSSAELMLPSLREVREGSGISQKGFAGLIGVNTSSVRRYERGERGVKPLAFAEKMAAYLGVEVWEITDRESLLAYASQIVPDGSPNHQIELPSARTEPENQDEPEEVLMLRERLREAENLARQEQEHVRQRDEKIRWLDTELENVKLRGRVAEMEGRGSLLGRMFR